MKRALWMLLLLALIVPAPALADEPVVVKDPAERLKKVEITVSFDGVTVSKAVDAIAKWGDANIVIPESLRDTKVSLHLEDVSAWQALQMIAKQTKHRVLIQPGSSIITLGPRLEGEVIGAHSVHNFDLKDFGGRYAEVLDLIRRKAPGARIIEGTSGRKGALTVAASKQELAIISEVIAQMRMKVNEELVHLAELNNLKQHHAAAKALYEAQIEHLQQAIAEARKAGKLDDLRGLEEKLAKEKANAASELARVQNARVEYEAMLAKIRADVTGEPGKKIAGGKAGKRRAPPAEARVAELKKLLAVAEAHYRKARTEKRKDDVKTLSNRVRELKRALRGAQAVGAKKVDPFAGGPKMPKFKMPKYEMVEGEWKTVSRYAGRRNNVQLDNLKKAYDALKKAGMHEQADEVAAKIRAVEEDLAKREAAMRAAKSRRGAVTAGGSVLAEVRALREEIHGLRAEVQMLNALVKKLLPERETRRRR